MRRYIAQAGGAPAGETIGASGIVTRMRHGGTADGRRVRIRVGMRDVKQSLQPRRRTADMRTLRKRTDILKIRY